MPHHILSLDLGSTFGWCLSKDGVITHSGEECFNKKEAHPGRRFLKFHNWLQNWRGVHEILYEDVMFHKSAYNARAYCGQLALVQQFALVQGIRLSCMAPSSVKKHFTGHGGKETDKVAMCNVALSLGWANGEQDTDLNHNEADAVALMWVVLTKREVEPTFA